MIAGEIRRYLRDNSAVRVSRSMRDLAYRALQAREKLTAESGRNPSVDELSLALGAPRAEVVFALDAISDPVSLSEPAWQDAEDGAVCQGPLSRAGKRTLQDDAVARRARRPR